MSANLFWWSYLHLEWSGGEYIFNTFSFLGELFKTVFVSMYPTKFPSRISLNVSQSVFLSDQSTAFIRTIWADLWSVIVFLKLMKLCKIRYEVFYGPWGSWESRTDRKLCTQHSPTDLSLSSQCLELPSRFGARFQKKSVRLFSWSLNRTYLLPHLAMS